jgi:hypothetical protein
MSASRDGLNDAGASVKTTDAANAGKVEQDSVKQSVVDDNEDDDQADAGDNSFVPDGDDDSGDRPSTKS